MTEWQEGVKVEVIPGAKPSHGGPCLPDEIGVCRLCGHGGYGDDFELMDEDVWREAHGESS